MVVELSPFRTVVIRAHLLAALAKTYFLSYSTQTIVALDFLRKCARECKVFFNFFSLWKRRKRGDKLKLLYYLAVILLLFLENGNCVLARKIKLRKNVELFHLRGFWVCDTHTHREFIRIICPYWGSMLFVRQFFPIFAFFICIHFAANLSCSLSFSLFSPANPSILFFLGVFFQFKCKFLAFFLSVCDYVSISARFLFPSPSFGDQTLPVKFIHFGAHWLSSSCTHCRFLLLWRSFPSSSSSSTLWYLAAR